MIGVFGETLNDANLSPRTTRGLINAPWGYIEALPALFESPYDSAPDLRPLGAVWFFPRILIARGMRLCANVSRLECLLLMLRYTCKWSPCALKKSNFVDISPIFKQIHCIYCHLMVIKKYCLHLILFFSSEGFLLWVYIALKYFIWYFNCFSLNGLSSCLFH